jgi:diketogulonate reductase-like aldo/keto reductase
LEENIDAVKVQLSAEEIAQIRALANTVNAALKGDRYPAPHMAGLLADTPPL